MNKIQNKIQPDDFKNLMGGEIDGILYNYRPQWQPERVQCEPRQWQAKVECQQQQARQQVEWQQSLGFLANLFISLSNYLREFCFNICPFQPPNIFPASSNFIESARYFLLSKDFVSHRINNRTFKVSNFLIEN